jgi:peroxiredoxin
VQRVYDTWKDKGVAVLGISIDGSGERVVKPYLAEHGYTFPTLIDQRMEVARQFGVRGVPFTFVINHEGHIVARSFGPFDLSSPAFAAYIQQLVAQARG